MTPGFSTLAVHGGEDGPRLHRSVTTPIHQTSTYRFTSFEEIQEVARCKMDGRQPPYDEYGRYGNPTQRVVEEKLAALEGGEKALLFASGMCAIATAMAAMLSRHDHLVLVRDGYARTRDLALEILSRWGIETTLVPAADSAAWAAAIRPNTRLIFIETPTNPYLRVADLSRLAELARTHGALTMVDSTFATPINLRPLEHGIDLVTHSATKYLGGHNDLLAGTVAGRREVLAKIEKTRGIMGGVSAPVDAYLLLRGLKTLDLRVRRQNENGERLARFLEGDSRVRRVHYPGLSSHPDHELARRQMTGFGGVVSFELEGDLESTGRFLERLRVPFVGPSLGGVESIVVQPAALFSIDPEERRKAGLGDTLVRYAAGIEDARDLIEDLDQALG